MAILTYVDGSGAFDDSTVPSGLLECKRHLTEAEIAVLVRNGNKSEYTGWDNIFVSSAEGEFDPELIANTYFEGWTVFGRLKRAFLKYHDLQLNTGVYNSFVKNVSVGDDCVISNVNYLVNYRLGSRVILFNVKEMTCTLHSKFGEGIIMDGETENYRLWIGVGNENDGRAVLAFEDMIPADAFLWSRYREDTLLMKKFVSLTDYGKSRKNDTYGIVGDDAVIKNSSILKDVKVGRNAYIKGAMKLKNITVLSSPDEVSQIGEGVEMVNGIMGYGSHVFYQAVAVRFVIGRNCQLKYGARLLNSVLGDNSTVSCCELLNNLIFPFHEQHHNSSFLIASTVMGQSNIASAATIGSNHNSRSPDCEMLAGRGFWPGLCSDFKFDSRFASFVLASKGTYKNELNITYPFSLISPCADGTIHIIPAYWFLYNMFAIVRNKFKFAKRDKRFVKVQHIETNPLAPDTIQEIVSSIDRIINLTGRYLRLPESDCERMTESNPNPGLLKKFRTLAASETDEANMRQVAKNYLHQNPESKFILSDDRCQKKNGALVFKPAQAYKEYRRMIKYFAVESLMDWCLSRGKESLSASDIDEILSTELYTSWINAGGQIIPEEKIQILFTKIKTDEIVCWKQVHEYYDSCQKEYVEFKARYGIYLIERLYSMDIRQFAAEDYEDLVSDVAFVAVNMLESSIAAREKDFSDFFRTVTFRNSAEREAVIGGLDASGFLKMLQNHTEEFNGALKKLFTNLL